LSIKTEKEVIKLRMKGTINSQLEIERFIRIFIDNRGSGYFEPPVDFFVDFDYPEEDFFSLHVNTFKTMKFANQEALVRALNEYSAKSERSLSFFNREKFIKGRINMQR